MYAMRRISNESQPMLTVIFGLQCAEGKRQALVDQDIDSVDRFISRFSFVISIAIDNYVIESANKLLLIHSHDMLEIGDLE
jgi:hypothetical protein